MLQGLINLKILISYFSHFSVRCILLWQHKWEDLERHQRCQVQAMIFEWASVAFNRPKIQFLFRGYFSHPIDKICNIEQAFTLQSMAIFRGSFLHYGGKIARSPRVYLSLGLFYICSSPALYIWLNLTLKLHCWSLDFSVCLFVSAAYQEGDVAGPDRVRPDVHQAGSTRRPWRRTAD